MGLADRGHRNRRRNSRVEIASVSVGSDQPPKASFQCRRQLADPPAAAAIVHFDYKLFSGEKKMRRCHSIVACLVCVGVDARCVRQPRRASPTMKAVSGDLSNDRSQPTLVPLALGTNSVVASMGLFDDGMDLDYMRINLPAGTKLTGILLEKFDGPDETGFIGIQAGTTFTVDPDQAFSMVGSLLGWAHFGPGNADVIGQNILPHLGQGQGAIGFTGPLTGPSYSFWIQQTGQPTNYQLGFVVAPVPEPATISLSPAGTFATRREPFNAADKLGTRGEAVPLRPVKEFCLILPPKA